MLSKVANRIFWLSRYMERAENTARLVNVYSNLLLDIPVNPSVDWYTLITITGLEDEFEGRNKNEGDIISYLVTERENPASLCSSLRSARENARTTRDILPSEVWNTVNEAYILSSSIRDIVSRTNRTKYLTNIINYGQRFEGIISSGMSRNDTYRFFILGRMLERTDMITRILDVGSRLLNNDADESSPYEGILWMNLLRSIAAYQMYRQSVRRRVNGSDVIKFLMLDKQFPRSAWYCAETLSVFSETLPNHEDVLLAVLDLKKYINSLDFNEVCHEMMHSSMDEIQKKILNIGNNIESTWFNAEFK
ncbi:alpha-E domain-containing protein [Limisalsivibrio acetivorans]|uniref:alpha-E domain-containing protein n=1 Tax=Limisalsivibrio acetivorans TaxID=1304888 RepID=UPI0003B6357C|nr:alpha-E domain-containing protein [Limisalsivibrio acetivorans]